VQDLANPLGRRVPLDYGVSVTLWSIQRYYFYVGQITKNNFIFLCLKEQKEI